MADVNMRILLQALGGAQVVNAISGIARAASGGSGSLAGALSGVALAAGGAAVALGAVSVKTAADFQQAMLKVQALAGLSIQQSQQMSDSILKMATTVGKSPKELADGLYYVASAGYRGADALNILKLSAEAAATGNFDMKTAADALTSAMNAFGVDASSASYIMDQMTATVSAGKLEWSSYANVVGKLSVISRASNVSFAEANAALATLTNSGYSARLAGTSLGNLFTQLDLKADSLAKNAKKLSIAFDEQKFKSMTLAEQIQYLTQITGGNQSELLKLMNNNATALKTFDALSNSLDTYQHNLQSVSDAHGATAKAFDVAQQGFNQSMARLNAAGQVLLITIGSQLLPVLTRFVGAITPIVSGLVSWLTSGHAVTDALSLTGKYAQIAIPILVTLAVVVGVGLASAFWSLAAAILANPLTWIILAIAGVTVAFVHFYQTSAPFRTFIGNLLEGFRQLAGFIQANFLPTMQRIGGFLQTYVWPILQELGAFIVSQFVPVWQQLVSVWNNDILPNLKQLWAALQPLMPLFQFLAAVVGGILVAAFIAFMGIIHGVIAAVATVLSDIGSAIGGVVQMITGIVQVVSGIFQFFRDLFTGNFGALQGDFDKIGAGILKIVGGFLQAVGSLVHAVFGGIGAFISGFVQGALNTLNTLLTGADKARIQAEEKQDQMKIHAINTSLAQAQAVIMNADKQRQGILKELEQTKDPKKRHELEMKLHAITTKEEEAKRVVEEEKKKKEGILKHLADLKKQEEEANKSIFQKAADWFGQAKDTSIQIFQNLVHGIGGKLTDLKNTVGGWFSSFGKFWHDRWQDIVNSVGNVFSGIGTFFHNALNGAIDVLNSFIGNLNHLGVDVGPIHLHPHIPLIPHLATGGVTTRGGLVEVGERGAEVVALPTGAAVYPHGSVPASAAGGGPTTIINISISTMARSQSEVRRMVDMFEHELGVRIRNITPGYNAGGVF